MTVDEPARPPGAGESAAVDAFPDDLAFLRLLLASSSDVLMHTVDGIVRWVSPSVRELLGYEPSELVGHTTTGIWHPADLHAAVAMRDAGFAGRVGHQTLRARRKDGTFLWVVVNIRPQSTAGVHDVIVSSLRDVTTEHNALEALAASEDRFRLLAENASDVVMTEDDDGRVVWVSPSITDVLGWQVDDVIGTLGTELVVADDRARARASEEETSAATTVVEGEFRFRTADGSVKWMSVRARGVPVDARSNVARTMSLRGIDAEVTARVALRAKQDELALILACTPDVIVHAVDGVVRWISPTVLDVLGVGPDDVVGTVAAHLLGSDDADGTPPESPPRRGLEIAGTVPFTRPDGTRRWIEIRWHGYTDDDGHEHTVGALRDVTTATVATQALAETEQRFRRAMTDSTIGMCIVSPEGRFIEVNDALCAYFGRDAATLRAMTWQQLTHPDDLAADLALVRQVRDGAIDHYRMTKRYLHADGSTRYGDLSVSGIRGDDGALDYFVSQIVDTTASTLAERQLAVSEQQFRLLAENASDTVWAVDERGVVRWSSPSVRDLLGWSVDAVVGRDWFDWLVADDRALAAAIRREVAATRAMRTAHVRFRTAGGGTRWIAVRVKPVQGTDGPIGRAVTLRDIDAEMAARRALESYAGQLHVILDASPDEVVRVDPAGRIDYVNERVAERTGTPAVQWVGRSIDDLGYPTGLTAALHTRIGTAVDEAERVTFELQVSGEDGGRWHEVRCAPECGPLASVHHVVVQIRDVTDRKAAEAELLAAATHDPLTGLANRVALVDEITYALSSARRAGKATGVLLIDLDHFKHVNDSLGHAVGDELIRTAAHRIADVMRAGDVVGRQGGDEFVVVMRDLADPTEAVHAAERLVGAFRRPLVFGELELFTTASIGVTVADPDGRDADDLLREADTAMYDAKNSGRDRLSVFNEALRMAVSERLRIENELRAPVERSELTLWYQPEIDLRTGRLRAVEALLRWHHPSGELYTADRFIDIAEESGLILGIGEWVIRTACAQAAAWAQLGDGPLTVRLNLSAVQLSEPTLVATLDDAVASSGVTPEALCVEITESALMRDVTTVRHNLEAIRDRHIRIAIDDFGTGYASLAYLRQFPVDVLKIDRSFVAQITAAEFDRRLVAGVIALSHSLDIPVTAEGVETEEQAALLRDFGCEGAQGWLFSGAVPAATIDELVAAR